MPGLINTHTHSAMTLFRGMADDLPLKQWLFEKIFRQRQNFLPLRRSTGRSSRMSRNDSLRYHLLCGRLFLPDQTIRAAHDAGLRGLIAQGVIDFPAPGIPDPKENIKTAREFIDRWIGFSDLIMPGIFATAL